LSNTRNPNPEVSKTISPSLPSQKTSHIISYLPFLKTKHKHKYKINFKNIILIKAGCEIFWRFFETSCGRIKTRVVNIRVCFLVITDRVDKHASFLITKLGPYLGPFNILVATSFSLVAIYLGVALVKLDSQWKILRTTTSSIIGQNFGLPQTLLSPFFIFW